MPLTPVMLSGFGLDITSDLPIPGALALAGPGNGAAIRVELGEPRVLAGEGQFARDHVGLVYTHRAGEYRCSPSQISITPGDPPDLADLGILLAANALPALLWQRGCFVLHAAGLRLRDGRALAIAGPRAAGKSRLVAALVAAGAALIGDDSLALDLEGDAVIAAGLPGGWFERVPGAPDRIFRETPEGMACGPTAIDFLMFLDGTAQELAPVPALAALELLLRHRHRPQVPQLLGLESAGLRQAARIAAKVSALAIDPQTLLDRGPGPICEALSDLALGGKRDSRISM